MADRIVKNNLVQNDGEIVQSGMLKGMLYSDVTATECSRLPHLLGLYEATLRPVVAQIISRGYSGYRCGLW